MIPRSCKKNLNEGIPTSYFVKNLVHNDLTHIVKGLFYSNIMIISLIN
jgi:hypothetical protein